MKSSKGAGGVPGDFHVLGDVGHLAHAHQGDGHAGRASRELDGALPVGGEPREHLPDHGGEGPVRRAPGVSSRSS